MGAVVRVAVQHGLDLVEAVDGLGQPRAAEEREDRLGLACDGGSDRRVVQHHHRALGIEHLERMLEAQGMVDRLLDEGLDRPLAERIEHAAVEAAGKALDPGEADAADLVHLVLEELDAGGAQRPLDLVAAIGVVIVVAEHRQHRDRAGAELLDQRLGLAGACRYW